MMAQSLLGSAFNIIANFFSFLTGSQWYIDMCIFSSAFYPHSKSLARSDFYIFID